MKPLRSLACAPLWLAGPYLFAGALAAQPQPASHGIWRNPQNSVHVRVEACGNKMCGVVVWASAKAKADAARGGTDTLVGQRLFKDFVQEEEHQWRGKVFVPDIGRTFSGTITVLDNNRLEGKGCVAGGLLCKAQIWTRLS